MKLRLDTDLDIIQAAAKKAGALYARVGGDREEGAADAILLVISYEVRNISSREYLINYLARRAAGDLIRAYQRRQGLTLSKPLTFVSLESVDAAAIIDDSRDDRVVCADEIGRVIKWLTVAQVLAEMPLRDREIINRWLTGVRQNRIAQIYELSTARVSQVIKEFKARARALLEGVDDAR